MNKSRKIMATILATSMVVASFSPSVYATTSTEKEEVVYAMLDSDGSVNGVYVVNSFAGGDITDYGNYSVVKNLTTTDEIKKNKDVITLHSDADKVYYQGDLETKDIPWNIEVRYYMDGVEYSSEDMAGKSGKLKIKIKITENKNCDENFWKGYALQASFSLDSEKCKNIVAKDATIANVGGDKQLSYIILPGKGADLTITADATEFEMSEISINGVKLNLDMDIDKSKLTDKVKEIQDAIMDLDNGAGKLNDSISSAKDGSDNLRNGAKTLYNGTVILEQGSKTLDNGVSSLNLGIETVQKALKTLDGNSKDLTSGSSEVLKGLTKIQSSLSKVSMDTKQISTLSKSSSQIKTGIDGLVKGLNTIDSSISSYYAQLKSAGISDINDYISKHKQLLASIKISDTKRKLYSAYTKSGDAGVLQELTKLVQSKDREAVALYTSYTQAGNDSSVISEYVQNAGALVNAETLLKGDMAYIQGSEQLISGISTALDDNGELMSGALTLQSSYKQFDAAIQDLVEKLADLAGNMGQLKDGINTLTKEYKKLDTGIGNYTDALSQIVKGYEKIYKGSLSVAQGSSTLYNGSKDLVSGALELYNGTSDLSDGTKKLKDGSKKLVDGTNEFYDKTKDMDSEISDEIDDTVDKMMGKDTKVVSFVSDKNTKVDSVLFVIKTSAIEIPKVEEVEEETKEEPSFLQKFLNIFK